MSLRFCVLTILVLAGCSDSEPAAERELKFGIAVQAGPMDTILVKDYKPESSLVVPVTKIDKAKVPWLA